MNDVDAPQVYLLGKTYLTNNKNFYIRNDPIVQMAAGDRHSIIITESGRAFAFGDNKSGQLGLGHRNVVEKISCIKSLKYDQIGEKLILVACGGESSLLATDSGSLYAFGLNNRCQLGMKSRESLANHPFPIKLECFHSKISWKQLAMGAKHTCALTNRGEVYVWGANDVGQCGLPSATIRTPKKLKLEYSVNTISCGSYHTALISDKGRLFLFGNNSNQQLGRAGSHQHRGPLEVSLPDPVRIVACGIRHTVVLTERGDVYTCGRGDRGQLGLGRKISLAQHFRKIEDLPYRLTTIAAGETHTAIVDSRGEIYLFGDGKHGKINEKTSSNKYKPNLVEQFQHHTVLNVVCGGCQTIVLAQRKSNETQDSDKTINRSFETQNEINVDSRNCSKKILISDDERSLSDQQSMPISEESTENRLVVNQDNCSTASSTTSGRTSSSISSLRDENSFETTESVDVDEPYSSTRETSSHEKTYLITSIDSSTHTQSNAGFFSRILSRKSSINTPRNSKTCSLM